MRLALLPISLSAALAACDDLPPPPNQTRGAPSYDASSRTLYLRGEEYEVPPSVNTHRLRMATMVTVTWEQVDDRRVVTRYSVDDYSDVLP